MLNSKSTKLVILICAIGSIVCAMFGKLNIVLVIFLVGFLYHSIDYYFCRDNPVSLKNMRNLLLEESYYLTHSYVKEMVSHVDEYIAAWSSFDDICRLNCMEAGTDLTKTKLTKNIDEARKVMKYGEEAILSNSRVLYARLKIIKLKRNITEEDKAYLYKYQQKNKEILHHMERLLGEVGELNKGNYSSLNIKEYVDALKVLNGN
ncbi:MAG: hypothetical protein IJO70_00720 [Lachnospiraceae bacterium]|nr:hypothetical protein [Lachnospiraceae bacterium]